MMMTGPTARHTGMRQSESGSYDFVTAANALSLPPLLENNGHGRTCCWPDRIAYDPKRVPWNKGKDRKDWR